MSGADQLKTLEKASVELGRHEKRIAYRLIACETARAPYRKAKRRLWSVDRKRMAIKDIRAMIKELDRIIGERYEKKS